MTDATDIRQAEIAARRHQFKVTTPAERKALRKRYAEAALTVALVAAVAACGYQTLSSPNPGADPDISSRAGALLTAENAPVILQSKNSRTTKTARVAPEKRAARRGASDNSPAPGSVSKRKADR